MKRAPTDLLTDVYQLTMAAGYFHRGVHEKRVSFELFVRRLPPYRRYMVFAGLETVLEHLRTADFFDVERFPTATVRVHSARPNGADAGGHPRYAATFDLTLLGTTKSVDGAFTVLGESPLTVEGELTVDRTQWGIGEPKSWYNPLSLENEIPIRFRATLEPR